MVETVMEKDTTTNENQETLDETVMEKNTESNEIQDTMEERTERNEIQEIVEDTVMEERKEMNEVQETVDETVLETNIETHEVQDTMDNETNTGTYEIQDTLNEAVMETNTETNDVQDTIDEAVPLGFNDPINQTTVSPSDDDNQGESQHANDSFPTPIEDESQNAFVSHTLLPQKELSSEMSLETPLEDKETERKMKEEEELEAVMEMLCRAENKLQDVKQRLERFRTPKGRKKIGKSSSCLPEEGSVVYVPTPEIKERR